MTKYLDYTGLAHLTEKIKKSIEAAAGTRTAGLIVPFAGGKLPAGYLLCNGAAYDKTLYPELFAAIGATYGGSGSTFNVPDLNGRVLMGVGSPDGHVEFKLGGKGGEVNHTLTADEMPSHLHDGLYASDDTPAYSVLTDWTGGTGTGGKWWLQNSGYPTSTDGQPLWMRTANSGGSQPHNNMQPYIVVNYMISTGKALADDKTTMDDLVEKLDNYKAATEAIIASKIVVGTAPAPQTGEPLSVYVQILS